VCVCVRGQRSSGGMNQRGCSELSLLFRSTYPPGPARPPRTARGAHHARTCPSYRFSPVIPLHPTSMINWRRLDAWRANPLLTNTMRASAPGLVLGAAAFAVYVAYDKTVGAGASGDGGHH